MGKTNELESRDDDELSHVLRTVREPAADQRAGMKVGSRRGKPAPADPPIEPAPKRGVSGPRAAQSDDPAKTLQELLDFMDYGRRPAGSPPERDAIPALFYQYRDLSRIRHDFPLCLAVGKAGTVVRPVREIVDELIARAGGDGDAGERLKRHVYQLEAVIKSLAEKESGNRLSRLWDRAGKRLLSSPRLSEEQKADIRRDLAAARHAFQEDGEVIACDSDTPMRLYTSALGSFWKERCQAWRGELKTLIQRLGDILRADFDRSPEARRPERLRSSVGDRAGADIDFEAMSTLLSETRLGDPLPHGRRTRVEETLKILTEVEPIFNEKAVKGGKNLKLPFRIEVVVNDCAAALRNFQAESEAMVEFFKAVRIARLEINNRYRDSVHDGYFEEFDRAHLTEEEVSLFPPALLFLNNKFFASGNVGMLLDLLNASIPIKILLQLDDLMLEIVSEDTSGLMGWPGRIAHMVMAMNDVFVLQSSVSNPSVMQAEFDRGFRYRGAALFCVYSGCAQTRRPMPPYLHAAAARESRVFPSFTFDPGGGGTRAERIRIADNPQSDRDWPVESFTYRNSEEDEITVELAFTAADFLYCDARLAGLFWSVPAAKWHENMIPLAEYLTLDEATASNRIPYLATVDADGRLGRVAMRRGVLKSAESWKSFWRNLQELGGVNDSFALRLLSEEKRRLEEEKQGEVDAIEKKYQVELDRDIGELTHEIIQRIARELIADGAGGSTDLSSLGLRPADRTTGPPPAAERQGAAGGTGVVAEEEVEEEEPARLLEDPYIDTPLCTSCNECTNLNGQMFAYNENKQAYIKDPLAGSYRDLVVAAELCPVRIIHPGKPKNPQETDVEDLKKRAAPFL